jgi:hypothetical protein
LPYNNNCSYQIETGLLIVENLCLDVDDEYDKSAKVSAEPDMCPEFTELTAYPNPVGDRIILGMTGIEDYELVQVFDQTWKSYPVSRLVTRSGRLEIDLTQLSSGYYFIRIIMKESTEVVPVIKD